MEKAKEIVMKVLYPSLATLLNMVFGWLFFYATVEIRVSLYIHLRSC